MYGLPDGFNANRFVGHTLEQVCFSENTVDLCFDQRVSVTIESSLSVAADETGMAPERVRVPVSESRLMQLLGAMVVSAEATNDGTLTLRFSNGYTVACYDDMPQYESYRLTFGDEEIVV